MENYEYRLSLKHSGVKGMRWGVRRYQNKDGSLTEAGRKRYAKELKKLEDEEAVVKRKLATKSKIDDLNARKKAVEDQESALSRKQKSKEPEFETVEQKKTRILNSHDPKLIYKNKDMFSDKEIQDAYLRLNNERNIKSLIPEEVSRGKKILNTYTDTSKTIKNIVDSTSDLYNSYTKAAKLINTIAGKIDKTGK